MDSIPKFQGALEKQGKLKTWTWKKYWFVLKECQLSYVKSQDKMASQGHIDLSQAQSARVVTGNHGYPFEIVTKSRTHLMSASSSEQRDKWLRVIHEAMSWSSRLSCRTGSINSTRASCNSLIDDEDEGYTTVKPINGSNSTQSSGYNSAASDNRTSGDLSGGPRDSGMEDIMYFNTNYSKFKDAKSNEEISSSVKKSSRSASESIQYEDVPNNRTSVHKGLHRLHEMKTPPDSSNLPQSLTARESDVSAIYDEVTEPMANLAISHIVKGYANIARNKGPQNPEAPKVRDSDPYDEVFDAIPQQRESKVVMRKSLKKSYVDPDSDADDNDITTDTKSDEDQQDIQMYATVDPEPSRISARPSPAIKPVPAPRSSSSSSTASKRRSRLPTDVQDYFQQHEDIPEVPHPRIELTHESAFDDIRQFLANNRGPNEVYTVVKSQGKEGKAIDDLRSFLTMLSV